MHSIQSRAFRTPAPQLVDEFTNKDLVTLKRALAPAKSRSPSGRTMVAFAPSFQGLRADKPAREIMREQATHVNR